MPPKAQVTPTPGPLEDFPLKTRPTCPGLLIPYENQLYGLPLQRLACAIEIHVATAFVKIIAAWKNIAKYPSRCMFVLPLNGTVTQVQVQLQDKTIETVVVPNERAKEGAKEKTEEEGKQAEVNYVPNLFRLPVSDVQSLDTVTVTVWFMEPLQFYDGMYHFTLPLSFKDSLIPANLTLSDVLSLKISINTFNDELKYECKNHELISVAAIKKNSTAFVVQGFAKKDETAPRGSASVDFELTYSLSSTQILPALVYQYDEEGGGNFCLFVTPPKTLELSFKRNIVFLMDRSGSMAGPPFRECVRALQTALLSLSKTDSFALCMFDHQQHFFRDELVSASEDIKGVAGDWASMQAPEKGGTDIKTPLEWALGLLNRNRDPLVINFVVLLTDGCVANERVICRSAQDLVKNTRILTLGVGSYCNWFFLKMLATIGRGFSDVVVFKERLFDQMSRLLEMCRVPIIVNTELDIPGVQALEINPSPMPDLFLGSPLTVSGSFKGTFPSEISFCGLLVTGEAVQLTVVCTTSDIVPVAKIFIKQRLDVLTAKVWLQEDLVDGKHEDREALIQLACDHSIPTAYTSLVMYETAKKSGDNSKIDDAKSDDDDIVPPKKTAKGKVPLYKDPKKLALLGVGVGVVVGAVAFSFGDVAGTVGNAGALGDLGSIDADCCGCDGCDCGDCMLC